MGIVKKILNRNNPSVHCPVLIIGRNPYFIAITRHWYENENLHSKIIYIGSVSKEEMPFRKVSSDGDLIYSYENYRDTLKYNKDGKKVLSDSEIPKERINALPSDIVVVYDMTLFIKSKKMKSPCDEKAISMYESGELEWLGEVEERNKKIDDILNSK